MLSVCAAIILSHQVSQPIPPTPSVVTLDISMIDGEVYWKTTNSIACFIEDIKTGTVVGIKYSGHVILEPGEYEITSFGLTGGKFFRFKIYIVKEPLKSRRTL